MRIKMEAAKEEKRRRETLADRRAQHIEATMRFQKGIKHFKMSKGSQPFHSIFDNSIQDNVLNY